ncbi:MAG TPA: EamA family transporter, partial [Candidatus Polarisedimenticolia bacterium]|nr:EamA family transporter [Candidatus Polarisedimenticolia bacterium]
MTGAADRRHAWLVVLNFAAIYTLWGSTYLANRLGVEDLPPGLMAGTRFLVSGSLLFAWLRLRRQPLPPRRLLGPIALTGLLLLFGGNGLVTYSEQTVHSGMAALIIANVPFFMVALEATRRDGEPITLLVAAGLLTGFSGMLILMWPKLAALAGQGLGHFRGELALLGANLAWATGSIYSKHRIKGVAPLMAVAIEMLVAGVALSLAGLLLGELPRVHVTPRAVAAVGWLIVAGSLCGYSAY